MTARRTAARALLALALLAGCGRSPGQVYPVPLAQARGALLRTGPPPFVFGLARLESTVASESPPRLTWNIGRDGVALFRFHADLTAVDPASTRVHVTMDRTPAAVARKLADDESEHAMFVATMEEQVAAALEGRAFRLHKTFPAFGISPGANIKRIQVYARGVATEAEARDRDNIERAYADEAAGR